MTTPWRSFTPTLKHVEVDANEYRDLDHARSAIGIDVCIRDAIEARRQAILIAIVLSFSGKSLTPLVAKIGKGP